MSSSDGHRSGLLTAGGILSIIAGIFQINNGVVLMVYFLGHGPMWPYWPIIPFLPGLWFDYRRIAILFVEGWRPPIIFFAMGLPILILGVLAVTGGISAVIRRKFGVSLTGAICALPTVILGILAVIFVALGKREFRKESLSSI